MGAPIIADRVAALVEELTARIVESLGLSGDAMQQAAERHVLRVRIAKLLSEHITRAASA